MSPDQPATAETVASVKPAPAADPAQQALVDAAREALRLGKNSEAEPLLARALSLQKTPDALVQMGKLAIRKSGPAAGIPYCVEALEMDPLFHTAHMTLADACYQMNEPRCLAHVAIAMAMAPQEKHYKDNFVTCAIRFKDFPRTGDAVLDGAVRSAVLECFATPGLMLSPLRYLWLSIFSQDENYSKFYEVTLSSSAEEKPSLIKKISGLYMPQDKKYIVFNKAKFDGQKDLSALNSLFFLEGLRNLQIPRLGFEMFLTALRARLLTLLGSGGVDETARIAIAGALAVYSFGSDFILDTTPAEEEAVEKLRRDIETAKDLTAQTESLAVYACYAPLHALANAGAVRAAFEQHPDLGRIVAEDIRDHDRLAQAKSALQSMSGFDNRVSIRVRGQYEDFPYPRWKHKPLSSREAPADLLRKIAKAKILVAGCGTGQEAASAAVSYPDADIEAIDLSTASLAYAAMKTSEFGLQNVRFRHGDILHLDFPDAYFDAISCHGVLHHMEDPAAGWKSLARCLKPGGLMRIALYSESARREFAAIQRIIKEKGIGSSASEMKRFRRDAAQILPHDLYWSMVTRSSDYYQLSCLRDLLFHEQEHRMTLPQIGGIMKNLGLSLIEFSVDGQTRAQYRQMFGTTPETMENWHSFEEKNPDTFGGMYQFWCKMDSPRPAA